MIQFKIQFKTKSGILIKKYSFNRVQTRAIFIHSLLVVGGSVGRMAIRAPSRAYKWYEEGEESAVDGVVGGPRMGKEGPLSYNRVKIDLLCFTIWYCCLLLLQLIFHSDSDDLVISWNKCWKKKWNASTYPRNITNILLVSVVQIQVGIVQVWCSRWVGGASEHLIWVELLWWLDWTDPNLDHPLYPTWNEGKFLKEGCYKKWQIHEKGFEHDGAPVVTWTDRPPKNSSIIADMIFVKKIHKRSLGQKNFTQKARKLRIFCSFLNCLNA